MATGTSKPRLITRALGIVQQMGNCAVWSSLRSNASGMKGRYLSDRAHAHLLSLLIDLDARESVVQPSRRKAHGLKPKRKPKKAARAKR